MRNQLLISALLGVASARDIPANVQAFYDQVKSAGTCSNKLATGFYALDGGANTYSYCGDHLDDYNVVYIKGTDARLADMDIDCDGIGDGPGNDGRCGSSSDTQGDTSFMDEVASYNKGVDNLNAFVHTYVVFGNTGSKSGWKTFDPKEYGIEPLSLMAVVCNNKLIYGIWGDENGDDGQHPMVGEAAISTATACFGTGVNGNAGHEQTDVLYIAFPGSNAKPGANGADWGAQSWQDFQSSIQSLGDKLIQRIGGNGTEGGDPGNGGGGDNCEWAGHCEGASCSTDDDCSDPWYCVSGKCGTD
ncbi:glycoside hydrolase [Dichotomopilus funicola]|uniref:Endo-chitosanase n=1 Tax=Dichotomopilus funicola TaxID=1934379 RepID=A0AAN6V4F2_9PEZI|nr:glycoside hydrolase [Dichotomopilus funicola]